MLEAIAGLPKWVFLLSFALGGWLCAYGGINLRRAIASKSWPYVQGRVTSARVRFRGGSPPEGVWPSFTPEIGYEYVVEGKQYTGTRRKFGRQHFNSESSAERIIGKYRTGATVDVHYCPKNPKLSALESGGTVHEAATSVAGIVLVIASIALLMS